MGQSGASRTSLAWIVSALDYGRSLALPQSRAMIGGTTIQ
jgi:hypothetical protein